MTLRFLTWKAANTSFINGCNHSPLGYPWCTAKDRWRSVDTHFQDGAGSMLLWFLAWKAANTMFMNGCNHSPLRLPKMHSKKSLMHRWRSFWGWCSDRMVYSFAKTGCPFVGYGERRPCHHSITLLAKQKLLTLRWRSFLRGSSNFVPSIFACKGGHYCDYGSMPLHSPWIIQDAWPKIVDAPLTVIFMR